MGHLLGLVSPGAFIAMPLYPVLRHVPFLRQILIRPRLTSGIVTALLVYAALPWLYAVHPSARLVIAFDAGALLYLVLALHMMATASTTSLRHRARLQDDGSAAILLGVIVASVTTLLSSAALFSAAKELQGFPRTTHILLAVMTIGISWAFTQMMFALHYAHGYFAGPEGSHPRGLAFPGNEEVGYLDFLYVACIIGTSGQTADVSFDTAAMRRIGLVHCVQAFFFNATLLGFSVNIAASML